MSRRRVVSLLAVLALCGCGRSRSGERSDAGAIAVVKVAGSTAILPFATEAANLYMRANPGTAIEVEGGGSKHGIDLVAAGTVGIATSDVTAPDDIAPSLEDHPIAVVAYAVMANRGAYNESVTSLTRAQLRGVFSGEIHDWSELGGLHQPIVVVVRPKGSGTRASFGSIVLGGDRFPVDAKEQESSALVQTMLLQTVGAISFLSLSYSHPDLKTFAVDGIAPTRQNVEDGAYPIWSYEHMYTRGPARGQARLFIDFVLSPQMQNEILVRDGFIPASAMKAAHPDSPR
jgi:phosphate transport system substrate-binding protein